MSKNSCYERPHIVTGSKFSEENAGRIKGSTSSYYGQARNNGTQKAGNMEVLPLMKCFQGKVKTLL